MIREVRVEARLSCPVAVWLCDCGAAKMRHQSIVLELLHDGYRHGSLTQSVMPLDAMQNVSNETGSQVRMFRHQGFR
jgi:hypothetical protein